MSIAHWCGPQKDDPSPIIYHGTTATDAEACMEGGQRAFCVTYYDVTKNANQKHPGFIIPPKGRHLYDHTGMPEARAFLDSGAFSFLVMGSKSKVSRGELAKQVPEYLQKYSAWLKDGRASRFDFYVTFDYIPEAPEVYKVTQQLRDLGIRPTPVYHGDSGLDWLQKYADDGYKLICLSKRNFLGDRKRLFRYYDEAFNYGAKNGLRFHGLASGLGSEVWNYPWWSVDSTSIITVGGKLSSLLFYDGVRGIDAIPIGRKAGGVDQNILDLIQTRGTDLKTLQTNYRARILFNAQTITEAQKVRKAKAWANKSLF